MYVVFYGSLTLRLEKNLFRNSLQKTFAHFNQKNYIQLKLVVKLNFEIQI